MTTTEQYICTIEVPGLPPGPNDRLHHMARARLAKRFRTWVALQARGYARTRGGPIERAKVVVTLVRRGGQERDPDNSWASVKNCVDGLTIKGSGGLLVDDDSAHILLDVRQETGRQRCVRIEVWEVLDANGNETEDHVGRDQAE